MSHRVGVVGLRQAEGLVALFNAWPDTTVTALCDTDAALLHQVGDRCGIQQRFTDYEAMLEADIDIVELSTPIQVHGQQSIAALDRGKHVLCQYIAANDPAEAKALVRAAAVCGKKYMFIETDCYERKNRIMMALARQGILGELTMGRGEYIHDCKVLGRNPDGSETWRGKQWRQGLGGMAVGVHTCMPLLKLFEERIHTIFAMGQGPRTAPEYRWSDTVIALGKFPSGRIIELRLDVLSWYPGRQGYFLQGTRGCFEYDRAAILTGDRLSPWKSLDQLEAEYSLPQIAPDAGGHQSAFALCIRDFMRAIDEGTQPPLDLHDALHITALGWAVDESLLTGVPVEVRSF
jgi:predicted dehydrogenase